METTEWNKDDVFLWITEEVGIGKQDSKKLKMLSGPELLLLEQKSIKDIQNTFHISKYSATKLIEALAWMKKEKNKPQTNQVSQNKVEKSSNTEDEIQNEEKSPNTTNKIHNEEISPNTKSSNENKIQNEETSSNTINKIQNEEKSPNTINKDEEILTNEKNNQSDDKDEDLYSESSEEFPDIEVNRKSIPPAASTRIAAIGIKRAPMKLRPFLTPNESFQPIKKPTKGDWLFHFPEEPQTYINYHKNCSVEKQRARNKPIYLLPIGTFDHNAPKLESLQEFASLYFCKEVKILPTWELEKSSGGMCLFRSGNERYKITCRLNGSTGNLQLLTTDIEKSLKKIIQNLSGFCVMAFSMTDLYPQDSWNFVFGEADTSKFVGVFSFARYSPNFLRKNKKDNLTPDEYNILLWRACQVMVHEIGHLFGLPHCCYFQCMMNGSNSLEESDTQPLHVCPVCLHKLQYVIGFDAIQRYTNLLMFYETHNLPKEAEWVKERLKLVK